MGRREAVRGLLRQRAARAICDTCVGDYLALSRRQVAAARSGLAHEPGFASFVGRCSGCCTSRLVTIMDAAAVTRMSRMPGTFTSYLNAAS